MAKLLIAITVDWYFSLHWSALAEAARAAGHDVTVVTSSAESKVKRDLGFRTIEFPWVRRSVNPAREAAMLHRLYRLYRHEKPDLVHHIALKPSAIGSLAARAAGVPFVSTINGLGSLFANDRRSAGLLRPIVLAQLRAGMRGRGHLTLPNQNDCALLIDRGIADAGRIHNIPGPGVDLERFLPLPEPEGPVTAAYVGRMIADKGLIDLVEAARVLRDGGCRIAIRLFGPTDPSSRTAISEERLRAWTEEGLVEWRGATDDVAGLWRFHHVAVQPSHGGEGLPVALMEAAACARPLVASDVPGCREAVGDGEAGRLVPPRDPRALADAIGALANSPDLRRRYGEAARTRAERLFSLDGVNRRFLALYDELWSRAGG